MASSSFRDANVTSPPPLPPEDQAILHQQFGRYSLQKRIGKGGMGEIFLGTAHGLEGFSQQIVIKRILDSHVENSHFVRMFINEAKLSAKLSHSNIVQIHEFGALDGQLYITMEYVAGRDLAQTLGYALNRSRAIPIEIAAFVISCICQGLHYAHTLCDGNGHPLKIIHRDISPSNILLSWNGEVKLADFGIAKATITDKTRTGMRKGKVCYMAPEQLEGKGDQRSDIYAAGVVLWEMVVGQPLFRKKNEAKIMRCIATGAIPRANELVSIPVVLQNILDQALALSPSKRFQTADEMADALTTFIFASGKKAGHRELAAFLHQLFRAEPSASEQSDSRSLSTQGRIIQWEDDPPGEEHPTRKIILQEGETQESMTLLCARRESPENYNFLLGCKLGTALRASNLSAPIKTKEGRQLFRVNPDSVLRIESPPEEGAPLQEAKKQPGDHQLSAVETLVAAAGGVVERSAPTVAILPMRSTPNQQVEAEDREDDFSTRTALEHRKQQAESPKKHFIPSDTVEVQMGYLEVESSLAALVKIDDIETDFKTPLLGENRLILSAGMHKVTFTFNELRRDLTIQIKPRVTMHVNLKLRE